MTDPIARGRSPRAAPGPRAAADAHRRQVAAATIQLRRAWHAAAGVPTLRLWRQWAGLSLDGGYRDARAAALAARQASRAVARARDGPDLDAPRVATAAAAATATWRRVVLAREAAPR